MSPAGPREKLLCDLRPGQSRAVGPRREAEPAGASSTYLRVTRWALGMPRAPSACANVVLHRGIRRKGSHVRTVIARKTRAAQAEGALFRKVDSRRLGRIGACRGLRVQAYLRSQSEHE